MCLLTCEQEDVFKIRSPTNNQHCFGERDIRVYCLLSSDFFLHFIRYRFWEINRYECLYIYIFAVGWVTFCSTPDLSMSKNQFQLLPVYGWWIDISQMHCSTNAFDTIECFILFIMTAYLIILCAFDTFSISNDSFFNFFFRRNCILIFMYCLIRYKAEFVCYSYAITAYIIFVLFSFLNCTVFEF